MMMMMICEAAATCDCMVCVCVCVCVCVWSVCRVDVLGSTLLPTVHVWVRVQRQNVDDSAEPVSSSRRLAGQHQQRQRGFRRQQHAPG